ncbi:MAG: (Fe-S)-binding protein [Candidatus Krumholzibacteria bacterium]|nr:(Fe-S)-binding protein [Candidatus Krumholzibacteria bacterium]
MIGPTDTTRLDQLLRRCVHCGLCLPHCATYLASGDETLSPRGRLLLLGEVLAGRLPPDAPAVAQAFDRCLGCLACSAVCPSGISAELLAYAREIGRSADRWRRFALSNLLDRRPVLHIVRRATAWARAVLARLGGVEWRARLAAAPRPVAGLARLVGAVPASPRRDQDLVNLLDHLTGGVLADAAPRSTVRAAPAAPAAGPRLVWFRGCADAALLPGTAARLRELLAACGCALVDPPGQVCCGAIAAHSGRPARKRRLRARNLAALRAPLAASDCLVVAAAGCGLELSDDRAAFGDKVRDAAVVLDQILPAALGSLPLRIAVHEPCHLRHGLKDAAALRRVLARIDGVEVLEAAEVDVCCGSAGVYALRHRELSRAMGRRKAAMLAATGCDLVVTTSPGCLGQIADGLAFVAPSLPIVPLSDLVWYAWFHGARVVPRSLLLDT